MRDKRVSLTIIASTILISSILVFSFSDEVFAAHATVVITPVGPGADDYSVTVTAVGGLAGWTSLSPPAIASFGLACPTMDTLPFATILPGQFPITFLVLTCTGGNEVIVVTGPTIIGIDCTATPPAGAIVGTSGNDVLEGTPGDDVIFGLGGNDKIHSGGGNDTICAGDGNDMVNGGGGDDIIDGGPGNDKLNGGGGDDTIKGGAGDDNIRGGGGDDDLDGEGGTNKINGGADFDTCANATIKNCEA